jgi:hypothetical protein
MDQVTVYTDIERTGQEILETNKFFGDLCSLMKNVEFIKFYNNYFHDWSDIQCMIFYMKMHTTIQYEYHQRYSGEIADTTMVYMLNKIMENSATRKYALDLFKDFKQSINTEETSNFRSLLNFDKTQNPDDSKVKLLTG